MNRRRSFLPIDKSKSNNQKKIKYSSTDYADISYKVNTSVAKSISSCDTDDTMSETVIELIKDIERFNIDRYSKLNDMYYPNKKTNVKVKLKNSTSNSLVSNKPTNNFNFKKVFEKIQQEKNIKNEKKFPLSSLSSSLNSSQNENPPLNLKDILFDKKTKIDKEKLNRNIRNITSLKKSKALNQKVPDKHNINEDDELFINDEEATPTFIKEESHEDSLFKEMKEFKRSDFFMPKLKSSVNFSVFSDLNQNQNSRNMNTKAAKQYIHINIGKG